MMSARCLGFDTEKNIFAPGTSFCGLVSQTLSF